MNVVKSILIRYFLILILVSLLLLDFFSKFLSFVFTYLSYFILQIFFDVKLVLGNIVWENNLFLIVDECIGISAYILLTFLFFSMALKKRVLFKAWSYSIILFTIINFMRIVFLMFIFILYGKNYFESIHLIFYEALTGIIVGLIFLYIYRKFKIKEKPLINDVKMIYTKFIKGK